MSKKKNRATIAGVLISVIIIALFSAIIFTYYSYLQNEIRERVIQQGKVSALSSAQEINYYLQTGVDCIKSTSFTLDNMIRKNKSMDEMIEYLNNESPAIISLTSNQTLGLYGIIKDEYFDTSGWVPDEGWIPTERPWYIDARAKIGRVAIVDPYLDSQTHTITITLAKTLCDTKSVVAIDFYLNDLQEATEKHAVEGDLVTEMVLDRRYQVIAHSDKREVGKDYFKEQDTFGKALVEKLKESKENHFSFTYENNEYIVYTVSVANDWLCVSIYDATAAFSSISSIWWYTKVSIFLVTSILIIISVFSLYKSRQANELMETTEKAVAISEAKTVFLSNMSHEIRTPINAVLGMNEMILRESEDESIIEYSNKIKLAGNTLLGLINDILDFSKIEAGKMEILPVQYDLSSVINDLVNMIQSRADNKGLLLELNFDEKTPKFLLGDEVRIKQIILNILTNAVKYTEKGKVTFSVGFEPIQNDPFNIFLKVSVRDTGIGIKPEDLKKLFIEFERIEAQRNRNIEGAGLGMTITKHLLEMMGSHLEVESVYGKGSVFSFKIKQQVVQWEELGDYKSFYDAAVSGQKKYKEKFKAPDAHILVVDDVQMNLDVFRSLLKRTAVKIDAASSGDECIRLSKEKKYDMIFLDYMMPEKDGIQTLHEMKRDNKNKNLYTPIVCLTANAVAGAREQYLKKGFDDYMTKPIDADLLEKLIILYLPDDKIIKITEEKEKIEDEFSAGLPQWLHKVEKLNTKKGISLCGSEDSYLETLMIYGQNAWRSANEIENLWNEGDLEKTTIKIHAIKSLSRTIGAENIGSLAEKLEYAGKEGDAETVGAEIDDLLTQIREMCDALSPLFEQDEELEDGELPQISNEELQDAYEGLLMAAENLDTESANYVFEYLSDYSFPDAEKEKLERIKNAVNGFNWEEAIKLLQQ